MDQNFQTSFIPKKPIVKETATASRSVSIWIIISLFILFTILLATGGLYFYKVVQTKNIAGLQDNLNKAKNRFEPAKITELQVLGKRLYAANELLSKHITIVPVFDVLQQLTMKTVRYTKFGYEIGTGNSPTINIKLSGVAIGYRAVALQSDLFGQNKNIIDPVFSNLTLDNSGNVLFDLDFSVDPNFVNYKQILSVQSQS